ncbi:MAG TPA: nitrate/sulfonate/bicarbonate ABC transporter ATP-binding protein [Gemmatimonadales bacterium]
MTGSRPAGDVLLEARNVTQRYTLPHGAEFEALRGVSLAVREREVVALVGPSGCGKSTLMRILAGLAPPVAGEVLYRGQPVSGVLASAAMVFQSFALLPWLTVEQNVAMGLAAGRDLTRAGNSAVAHAIELVGLSGFEQAYPRELSGGMKQRVGFARALAVEPEILFMDEPFGALDALTAENLRAQVTELWQDPTTGVSTLIVVTHSVDEAVYLAQRIVVFGANPGHIREILENPLPYPRDPRTPVFQSMVDRLHAILTATLLPEGERIAVGLPPRLIPFPRVHVPEVMGLLDHLAAREQESGSVFDIAEQLAVDYDHMTAVVRAAEQLGWVITPGEVVKLTPTGRLVVAADTADRKGIAKGRIAEHPLFARVLMMLREAEGGALDDDEVLADLTIMFPFSRASSVYRTLIEWGRYTGLLDHSARDHRLTLHEQEPAASA